jgi:NAD(P)H dehydrogenase (quinone)
MQVLPPFFAYHVPYITDAARREILERYRAHLLELEQAAPMPFPSLEEFDDKLYPRPRS